MVATKKQVPPTKFLSLGWACIEWVEHYLVHGPGDIQGEPIELDDEQCRFILRAYELDAKGKRKVRRGFFSRAKGRAKSELAGMIACFEFLGPARFSYFDKDGEPVGKPVKYPFIRCMATEETQSGNTYDNVRFMLEHIKDTFSREFASLDVGLTRCLLGSGGEIVPSTASSSAKDGGKESFVVFDESHIYTSNELKNMHRTVLRNLGKRKIAEPWAMETSTMYAVGEDSVAEQTHQMWVAIQEGRAKNTGLLFDHIQAPEVANLSDTKALKKALSISYGPAFSWMDIDRLIAEIQDPLTRPADARRYFLNQPSTDTDKYMNAIAWNKQSVPEKLAAGEKVVLGFDGSRKDDATFLTACRLSDKKIFQLHVWERPAGVQGYNWEVPRLEVDNAIRETFASLDVVKLWGDPSGWQSYLDAWNSDFAEKIVAIYPSSQRKLMAEALDRFLEDVLEGRLTHDGSAELTRHVLNAVPAKFGQVAKPSKNHKIDGLISAVLAYMGTTDVALNALPDEPPARYISLADLKRMADEQKALSQPQA